MSKLTFISCDKPRSKSDIVLFGAPFDGTTSFRPGTRFAPNAIRIDSYGLETYSPYQDNDLTTKNISDIGDCDAVFGNTEKTLDVIYQTTKDIVSSNQVPFMIGGEHLVSLPVLQAVYEKHPDLRIIHFDAHTDLRDDYLGEQLSHATVIKRIIDIIGTHKVHQFGIRSGLKAEFEYAKNNHYIEPFIVNTVGTIVEDLKQYPIYITLDLDVLDPSIMGGTGTPEPGGVSFTELLNALLTLKGLKIVGMNIVELDKM